MKRLRTLNEPVRWIPSLYFAKGLSQVMVMVFSVLLYKQLGLSNAEITFYVAWLYLPWVLKPLWKPFTDQFHPCRWWILLTQVLIGAGVGGMAFTIQAQEWLQGSLFLFWLLAFASAVHNEATDSLYRQTGNAHRLSLLRTLSQKAAVVLGQGVLVMIAGNMQVLYRNYIRYSWGLVFYIATGLFLMLFLYHLYVLPDGKGKGHRHLDSSQVWQQVRENMRGLLSRPPYRLALLFLLIFRLPEALLNKISVLFLIDSMRNGGLGLSPQEYGLVMGTVGIIALSVGSVLGAKLIHRLFHQMPSCQTGASYQPLWWMAFAMTLPDIVYVYLSYALPDSLLVISLCVLVEQLGYGFAFAFYLYMVDLLTGVQQHEPLSGDSGPWVERTFAKAMMALSFMLPTMIAGVVQMKVGYRSFFILVVLLSVVTFAVTARLSSKLKKE